ncbi:MAG: hypothetical protein P1V51_15290 [Deltaproteobacteria bacterium]|nr:hypothetical protein [Deltaproteobacteria bacterium]
MLVLVVASGCGPGEDCDTFRLEYEGVHELGTAPLIFWVQYESGAEQQEIIEPSRVSSVLPGTVAEVCRGPVEESEFVPVALSIAWLDLAGDEVALCEADPFGSTCVPGDEDPFGTLPFTERSGYGEAERVIVLEDR